MSNTTKSIIFITFTILFILSLIFYFIFYIDIPEGSTKGQEICKLIFLSIPLYGVLFSSLLTSINSLEVSKINKDRIKFDKTENSFLYINRWDSASLKEARDMTRKLKKEMKNISKNNLIKKIEGPYKKANEIRNQENLKRSVITMFNYFEEIYLSIEKKRVDSNVLKKAFKDTYIDIFKRFNPWLENDAYVPSDEYKRLLLLKKAWEK